MINNDLRSKAENGGFARNIPLLDSVFHCFGLPCRIKTVDDKPEQEETNGTAEEENRNK
jgi:hypothetical protein